MNDLDLLRRFRDDVPLPDEDSVGRAYRKMIDSEAAPRPELRLRVSRRPRRWAGAGLVAAAVAVAIALVLPVVLPDDHAGGPSAALALEKAAQVAAGQQQRSTAPT